MSESCERCVPCEPRLRALFPFFVFVIFYVGLSLLSGNFYSVPMPVAFLVASATALLLDRKTPFADRAERYARDMGDTNIMLMCMIFILAGMFAATAKAMGAVDSTVLLARHLIPGKFLLAGFFIMHPERLQVVVASNLFGDILTDLGSAMLGSIGVSPSGNINPEGKYPSMFEPIHGSAPDIAGKGIANPTGTFWAIAMMLEQLGEKPSADLLMDRLCAVLKEGKATTPDIGGKGTTTSMTDALIAKIRD